MGEFMPNDSYRMLDRYNPKVEASNAEFRTKLREKGYRLSDYANYQSVLMLALVKYADLNFQSCLGHGWYSGNNRYVSNGDVILGGDGYISLTSSSSIKVMGITDFYGNVWKHCDGTFEYGGYVYINNDLDNITEWPTMDTWKAMGYKKTNIPLIGATTNTYISNIAYDSQFPFVTYPIDGNEGDSINPIGDACWTVNDNTMRHVALGGSSWDGLYGGPFAWGSNVTLLHADTYLGALVSAFPAEPSSL